MELTGEIGKLVIDGNQVGGLRGWTVFVETKPPIRSWVTAAGFWMRKIIETDKVLASFYRKDESGELKLVCERMATIKLPESYPFDVVVPIVVELTFDEDFDWRKL